MGPRPGARRRPTSAAAPRLAPRVGGAVLAGVATACGFAPLSIWPAALLGLAAFFALARSASPRRAAGLGFTYGVGLFGLSLAWATRFGWWVLAAFVAMMALWMLLVGLGVRLVAHLPGWPVWTACLWAGYEAAAAKVPFGGFNWVRLAYTTPDQPLSGFLRYLGAPGTGWVVALCAALLTVAATSRGGLRLVGLGLTAVVFLVGSGLLAVAIPTGWPNVNVGMVQGNVDETAGATSIGQPHTVTANHQSATVQLMAEARARLQPMPDFVLWPENSVDYDPTLDAQTHDLVDASAKLAGRPILLGAVMDGPGENGRQTSALWWTPDDGVTARYDKRNVVPFGEYLPWRSFFLTLVPETAEVGKQSVPGTRPGVLHVTLPDGRPLAIGDAICYDLAFDDTVYDTVRHGAQILVVQSSNVTFAGTFQPSQQFQITRVRAMELGREIVVSTTASLSGLIDAQGRILDRTTEWTAAADTYQVPERTTITPAVRIGPVFGVVAAALGGLAVVAGAIRRRRSEAY